MILKVQMNRSFGFIFNLSSLKDLKLTEISIDIAHRTVRLNYHKTQLVLLTCSG